ncbi:DUF3306 domain-containing protein [Marinobacter sp.]|uniref:DUF3306 domain-containing protein n=1 Tax=Marinobacter sp. TaxID=50741 RepID=UPI003A93C1BB
MAESRWQRWSRQKAEAAQKQTSSKQASSRSTPSEPVPPSAPAEQNDLSPEVQELAVNESLPEHEVLAKYGLPNPDAIELGTDITGFMGKEIPELLRRKALRALWRSNPVLAVLDGLNDYDEDFTDAGLTVKGAKTIYKVGQGLIDKTKKVDQQLEELTGDERVAQTAPDASIDKVRPPDPADALAAQSAREQAARANQVKKAESLESLERLDSEKVQHPEKEQNQPDEDQAPRYRPRMYFED